MRRILRTLAGVILPCSAMLAAVVPKTTASAVALNFTKAVFGTAVPDTCWDLVGVDGTPAAYMFEVRLAAPSGKVDRGAVLISAVDNLGPVFMYYRAASVLRTALPCATEKAEALLGVRARLKEIVYYSPLSIWFEFVADTGSLLVSPYDLSTLSPDVIRARDPLRAQDSSQLALIRADWLSLMGGPPAGTPESFRLLSVPDIDWSYGCGPTAMGNILEYWDNNGYESLTDSWFTRWDHVEQEWDYVTNAMQQLAIACHTDTFTGGTYNDSMVLGTMDVCNSSRWDNLYSFFCYDGGDDRALLLDEINIGRPVFWTLWGHPTYQNHFVTAMGWGPPTSWYICIHDEWSNTPEEVVIHYNNWGGDRAVDPVLPSGPPGSRIAVYQAPSSYIQGLAFDGQFLWATVYDEKRVYQLNPDDCSIRRTISIPDSGCTDIAYGNDEYLYVHNRRTRKIYKLDKSGRLAGQYVSPCAYQTGLARIPGDPYFYLADRDSNRIKKTDNYGHILQDWPEPFARDGGPRGLCWDYNGHFLHVITDFTGDTLNESYVFELANPPTSYVDWFRFRTNDTKRNIRAIELDGRGSHNTLWIASYYDASEIYKVTGFGNHGIGLAESEYGGHPALPSPLQVCPNVGPEPFSLRVGPLAAPVTHLRVYDIGGRHIRTLCEGVPGARRVDLITWDGRSDRGERVPAGTYFFELRSGSQSWSVRAVLIR